MDEVKRVGAVVLAAGHSRRFGGADKKLAPLADGTPVLQACIDVCAEAIEEFVVVLRKDDDDYARCLDFTTGKPVFTGPQELGMGSSLARGVKAMAHCDAILVLLGDMPFLRAETIRCVAALSRPNSIVAPMYRRARGHPVAFSREFFSQLVQIRGDFGANTILRRHASRCRFFESEDRGVVLGIDTRDQLASARCSKHAAAGQELKSERFALFGR